jgi:hypothetical protein
MRMGSRYGQGRQEAQRETPQKQKVFLNPERHPKPSVSQERLEAFLFKVVVVSERVYKESPHPSTFGAPYR